MKKNRCFFRFCHKIHNNNNEPAAPAASKIEFDLNGNIPFVDWPYRNLKTTTKHERNKTKQNEQILVMIIVVSRLIMRMSWLV